MYYHNNRNFIIWYKYLTQITSTKESTDKIEAKEERIYANIFIFLICSLFIVSASAERSTIRKRVRIRVPQTSLEVVFRLTEVFWNIFPCERISKNKSIDWISWRKVNRIFSWESDRGLLCLHSWAKKRAGTTEI